MTYYCYVCGAEVDDLSNGVFCPKCGARVLFKKRPPVIKEVSTD